MPPKKTKFTDNEKIESMEQYKEYMKEWIDICDHLEENNKVIKPIKDRKTKLELLLQKYMINKDIGSCQQSNNTFIKVEKKTLVPSTISKKTIENSAQKFFEQLEANVSDNASTFSSVSNKSSKEIATDFVNFVYDSLEPVEKCNLKRIQI